MLRLLSEPCRNVFLTVVQPPHRYYQSNLRAHQALNGSKPLEGELWLCAEWWQNLPVIHLPVVHQEDGSFDYLILNISPDMRLEDNHVVGFAAAEDANKFQWLFRSMLGNCRCFLSGTEITSRFCCTKQRGTWLSHPPVLAKLLWVRAGGLFLAVVGKHTENIRAQALPVHERDFLSSRMHQQLPALLACDCWVTK